MRVPVSEARSKKTLRLSLPEELVQQVRVVAWRKRLHVSRLCRDYIEAGLQRLAAEDEVAADAVAPVSSPTQAGRIRPGSVDRSGASGSAQAFVAASRAQGKALVVRRSCTGFRAGGQGSLAPCRRASVRPARVSPSSVRTSGSVVEVMSDLAFSAYSCRPGETRMHAEETCMLP